MSFVSKNPLLLAYAQQEAAGGISRSLRFNSSDSAYLSRTPASAGNRKTWTWAAWVKRSDLANQQTAWSAGSTGTNRSNVLFQGGGQIRFFNYAGSVDVDLITTPVYRDASAWYHLVITVDTTQATSTNRFKLYVNDVQVTVFSTATYPSLNQDLVINSAIAHGIGRGEQSGGEYFSGYLADIHFIDGQALTPSSFTEVSATTGQLIPKAYTGSYGTNGFKLTFSDNSGTTSTTLGKDAAGSNNWTPNNFSVASGSGNDSLVDTPTSYGTDTSVGGEVRGNYCTLNPLDNGGGTLSNGNLDFSNLTAAHRAVRSTIALPNSGKFYAELTVGTTNSASVGVGFGFATQGANLTNDPANTGKWSIYLNGIRSQTTTVTSGLGYFQANDILQIAYDGATGNAWVGKNNVWYNSTGGTTGNPGAGTNPTFTLTDSVFPYCSLYNATAVLNGGARAFAYTSPSGFKALCDTNLPAPVVAKPNEVMDILLWSGTGGNRSFSSLNMSPDFVWIKQRNQSYSVGHQLYDIVRGAGSLKQLDSSNTTAEGGGNTNQYGYLSSFDSTGFSVAAGSIDSDYVNKSGVTYVAWAWDAGSSTATNTQGSITSQCRTSVSSGFSVITYTGTGAAGTVGHGLGVAPSFFVVKSRSAAGEWVVYHQALGRSAFLQLQDTAASVGISNYWGTADPTSTVFSLNSYGGNNFSGRTYVCYAWAPVAGYSSFGSYVGNGSADGPFVYTGFRPRWVMVKNTTLGTASDYWVLFDAARNGYNVTEQILYPNFSNAEDTATGNGIDFLSNGFKWRATHTSRNASGSTYIYAAFAESPFQFSRAR